MSTAARRPSFAAALTAAAFTITACGGPMPGHCNAAEWLTNDDAGIADLGVSPAFEVGRFPIRPVWTGHSYVWEKA